MVLYCDTRKWRIFQMQLQSCVFCMLSGSPMYSFYVTFELCCRLWWSTVVVARFQILWNSGGKRYFVELILKSSGRGNYCLGLTIFPYLCSLNLDLAITVKKIGVTSQIYNVIGAQKWHGTFVSILAVKYITCGNEAKISWQPCTRPSCRVYKCNNSIIKHFLYLIWIATFMQCMWL